MARTWVLGPCDCCGKDTDITEVGDHGEHLCRTCLGMEEPSPLPRPDIPPEATAKGCRAASDLHGEFARTA